MCKKDYTHACIVCKTEYPATLNKDGQPRATKVKVCSSQCRAKHTRLVSQGYLKKPKVEKVYKDCVICGNSFGPLTPRLSKSRECCSKGCANTIRNGKMGYRTNYTRRNRHCFGCGIIITRKVRSERDSGRYCSRECAFETSSKIAKERIFLRRLSDRHNNKDSDKRKQVRDEVSRLRAIGRSMRMSICECTECGSSHVRRRPYVGQCSRACEIAYNERRSSINKERRRDYNKRWRKSPEGRARRSREKAKRRASERMDGADNIDPIKVFKDANWVCYICGDHTPEYLRGTTDDKAPELEHVVALANGGTHTWDNVRCACRKCNAEKGAKEIEFPFISEG